MRLLNAFTDKRMEAVIWRLHIERAKEDDPFLQRSARTLPPRRAIAKELRERKHHRVYVIQDKRRYLGVVQIAKNNEVGVTIFQQYRSMGYGIKALALLLQQERPIDGGRFKARIHPHNFRSIRMVEHLGFKHVSNLYELTGGAT